MPFNAVGRRTSFSGVRLVGRVELSVRGNQECIATIWCLCTRTNKLGNRRKRGVRLPG